MEGKKIKKHLKCVLTQDEVRELGGDLARLYSEITDLEEQKKAVASDFKSRIDSSTAQATGVARKIQNGYEFRDVECSVETDYVKGEVHIIRDDTGEIVDTRNMTQEERQEKMFPED